MTRKRVVIIVLVVAAIAAGAAYAGGWFHRDTALQGSGTVEARDIRVGSKIAGRIDKVLVREGDKVKAGQVLVTFDDREMMATLQQSHDGVAVAEIRPLAPSLEDVFVELTYKHQAELEATRA
jgi:HlyD family secretion protein